MNYLLVFFGLVLLVVGGEFLVRSSVALSFKLHLSKMVIGLTVVSFATSAPELLVSLQAALNGFSDISLGNVIGSNIANIGLVLGITAIISPLGIDKDFYKLNWPVMMVLSIALYFILQSGLQISRSEGVALLLVLFIYLYILIIRAKKQRGTQAVDDSIDEGLSKASNFKIGIWLLIGGVALYGGSELLVSGAVSLAEGFGVSERVIAVTMIAVGTSIPELAASVMAALKKEKAISLGNLIGSNIFNISSVLGLTAIIQPIAVKSPEVLTNDIFWMIGFAAVLVPLAFLPKKFELGRKRGLFLFLAYIIFIGLTITS
ncbi:MULTISPECIES: calcium/sodium antiporter [Aequorivita]|uniref:Calcium/sodium antiporter n=1 Tax=Aequorivita iocasae TaxID=2803865 RepID=A0ABX7DT25_9FLAO|nr:MULTISPECIES: calcium/sodium antiporter [Aequorivita]QQX76897.1 calcium/sodium antiporter [Aequorivita iocasae]UCA56372.1 calcium/sodium antiporter [Aequorivita sp. F7]